jgi:Ser/Thr protein kinase RdoA (MazF antagonist)
MDFRKANFSHQEVLEILNSYYQIDVSQAVSVPLNGIANNNYRVSSDDYDIVLKAYSHGQSDRQKILKEIEAVELFQTKGVSAPPFIKGTNDQILQEHAGFYLVATKFIDGNLFDGLDFTPSRMQSVGRLTATVELAAKQLDISNFPYISFRQEFDDVSHNLISEIKKRNYQFNLDTYHHIRPLIDSIIKKLDLYQPKQFLHKDIWPWNIIETPNQLYLLDFNDWAIGHPIIELSVPLLEFSMFKSDTFNHEIAGNILAGYTAIKPLTYSPTDLWETMVFISYLYFAYNVIQADDPFESEIYLKRLDTLMREPEILTPLI